MKDIKTELEANCECVYYPESIDSSVPSVLCIMPSLSLGGSQTVFVELMEFIQQERNYSFCVFSPDDGEYRDVFLKMGCIVCICPNILNNPEFREVLKSSFSRVIMNSFLTYPYLMVFVNTEIPVFWWIHEPFEHIITCCRSMPDPGLLSSNIHIYGVGQQVETAFEKLYKYHINTMHFAINDVSDQYSSCERDSRVTFLMPAAYTDTKGQDILLKAISCLPDEFRNKALFQFCGYEVPGAEDYYNTIMSYSEYFSCISHLGKLSRQELYRYYAACDCVVAPSRVDAGPTTIAEGLMFHKLALVSDKTGVSHYITDCINGFVFRDEDELIKRLLMIISDVGSLGGIAERGYEIWRQQYSPEYVKKVLFSSGVF